MLDKLTRWLAWKLPRRLVYFCSIRLMSNATTGKYSNEEVTDLTTIKALQRWED